MQGITFLEDANGKPTPGKPEQVWKFVDWYSIICSMMLQYKNVYADLSYIIHKSGIQPLLKYTLSNDILKERVLFGTDFYVVRNHKSEKNMLVDITDHMNEQELDQIGRINPRTFLNNCLPI
jgi:predicted TIM-barrel fold metal-dependent hydrolase